MSPFCAFQDSRSCPCSEGFCGGCWGRRPLAEECLWRDPSLGAGCACPPRCGGEGWLHRQTSASLCKESTTRAGHRLSDGKRLVACCKTTAQLGELRSNRTPAFQLQKTKARGKTDILARGKKRDSIVPPLLVRIYISRAQENPQHAHIVLQHLLEPSLLPCPAPHIESPRETVTAAVCVRKREFPYRPITPPKP